MFGCSHLVCPQVNRERSRGYNDHSGVMPVLTYEYALAEGICRTSLYRPPRRSLLAENISKPDTMSFQECLFLPFVVLMHLTSNQPPKCEFSSSKEMYQHNFITTTCVIMSEVELHQLVYVI